MRLVLAIGRRRAILGLSVGLLAMVASLVVDERTGEAVATTFTVNSASDADDGTCDAAHCSLREAINAANANVGTDTLAFDIPGAGPHTIQPTSALPTITDPVIIDGYTQAGASPNTNGPGLGSNAALEVELDGTNAGTGFGAHGLRITAGSTTVRGLVINRFDSTGIQIRTNGGNVIVGNFIGTDVSGSLAQGNAGHGILIDSPDNRVGGTDPEARNVISANFFGVSIGSSPPTVATGNLVQGNLIGTDVTGKVDLGNLVGVGFNASNNILGGSSGGARNIISGNNAAGVQLAGVGRGVTGNVIQGNFIGTDVTGTVDLGNALYGVSIFDNTDTKIGGLTPGTGNVISGNDSSGILIGGAQETLVEGNLIGTDLSGTINIGNLSHGVRITRFTASLGVFNSPDNTIGGTTAGAANTIAFNGGDGVRVNFDNGNRISRNSIFDNAGLGIDLVGSAASGVGCTPIPSGGSPNNCLKFPVLMTAGDKLFGVTCGLCTVEIFLADNTPDDNDDHGEGRTYLTSTQADLLGDFSVVVPCGSSTIELTATASNTNGDTSEFARNVAACGGTNTPVPTATPAPTATPPPPVGGISLDSDLRPLPLETTDASGGSDSVVTLSLAIAVAVVLLASIGWYATCRRLR